MVIPPAAAVAGIDTDDVEMEVLLDGLGLEIELD